MTTLARFAGGLIAVAMTVAVALAGCTPMRTPAVGEIPLAVGRTETTPPVLVHNYDDAQTYPGLLVIGRVRYLAEPGCFVVDGDHGPPQPAVWPLGTAPVVRDGTLTGLEIPGAGIAPLDTDIEGRGLPHALSDGWARLPQDCFPPRQPGELAEYLLVYSVSEVA